ncbi:hypothetical protein SOVF_106810 [Spinacia oleracea]|nr:hypothetical protein SOVF_106810 [Spinacia oleracea]
MMRGTEDDEKLQHGEFSADYKIFSDEVEFDDDGKPRRTGTVWTASAHIVTAIIGSGVLSLAWGTAQLGWVGGLATLITFSFITYYTSNLLADCYRSPDPVTGKRNYSYMEEDTLKSQPAENKVMKKANGISVLTTTTFYMMCGVLGYAAFGNDAPATTLAMAMPFFNDFLALLGSVGFWPLTVYFPVQMHIAREKIKQWSLKWCMLQLLNFLCLLVSLAAAAGSIQGVAQALRTSKPFHYKV